MWSTRPWCGDRAQKPVAGEDLRVHLPGTHGLEARYILYHLRPDCVGPSARRHPLIVWRLLFYFRQNEAFSPYHSWTMKRSGHVRWWIVWTLFFSTVTNYISRQTFSVLSPMIAAQYHLSHTDLAKIVGAFQFSYAVTWLLGGIFLDAVGTRLGLALAVIFWSVVNILTGFAGTVFGFASFRFLLGIGGGFNWPAASKTVAEWFPSQERSVAVAIFDSGSSVGGALAAFVIPWIAIEFGWRWSFVFSDCLALYGWQYGCASTIRWTTIRA